MNAKEVVNHLSNFVNSYNHDEDGFIEAMSREHRTLQQSMTRLMFKWIEHCATDEYHYDGRNEATHKTSKELIGAFSKLKEEQLPNHWKDVKPSIFLPLI